jgi:L-ornithine N5-oxygenase
MQHIHDLIGVGFGPSNIALAIALEEKRHGAKPVDACSSSASPASPGIRTCCWTRRTCRSRS